MPHLSCKVDSLFSSNISYVLHVVLLLYVSMWFFEGSDGQGRGRRYHLNQAYAKCAGPLYQALHITGCLGDVTTKLFWRQTQGIDLRDQGRCGINFPTKTPQINTASLLLGLNKQYVRGSWY